MVSTPGFRITINRASVLTLWAVVVAERLGYDRDEVLTLGRAMAGLNVQSKARRLGLISAGGTSAVGKRRGLARLSAGLRIELLGRAIPAICTRAGVRAFER